MEKTAARIGEITQVDKIFPKEFKSVGEPVNKFQPIMAPTMACVVETGRDNLVIQATVAAAANATVNDPAMAFTAPNLPRVWAAPAPLITAPIITNTLATIAANLKRTILEPTAVPKTLAASLAPSDQPKNNPLSR